ncbi:cysteine desulfurase NifS [Consotaella salsifontis]|uniref:Cysteine desulfurase n=1 Tax=Consotaella salsifontis TaxID=1365950 RepID=A0A1T4S8S3_9HYPH|nr:cysteine desulfurase NifS [Consotaella salsifontis]SKA24700.1 cysteine desulfurase [Consotaella salsifontis]
MRRVYLDNNATTQTRPEVVAAMLPFFTEDYGNPSSGHRFGAAAADAVQKARRSLQALIGAAREDEILFTSGGTESDNAVLRAALCIDPGRTEIVTSAVEHPAVLRPCAALKQQGVSVRVVPVDRQGRLDIDAYRAALGPKTALVSLMWANNETGTIFPVEGLAEIAHAAGALFHTDAVQAVGKVPVALAGTEIDMLSLSAHKFGGPKGVGALYVRRGVAFEPLIRGGRQQRGRRAGTENVPAIVGLGKAAELAQAGLAERMRRVARLRDRLETELVRRVGSCLILGDPYDRLANTSCIAFEFVDAEAILMHLDRQGIAASAGSACASGTIEPSHVLRAMAVPFMAAHGAIRFSLGEDTTGEEVDRVLDVLPGIVARLRGVSPFWPTDGAPQSALQPRA